MKHRGRYGSIRFFSFIAAVCIITLAISSTFLEATVNAASVKNEKDVVVARPSVNGQLGVRGRRLVDQDMNPVILRGLSTHGTIWFPEYVDEKLFRELSTDWNCNLIRLATYSELYCNGRKEESLELLRKGIDAAVKADMYVMVDWHILADSDPNTHINTAIDFFDMMSKEYADVPNVIYEICNEPNGNTDWKAVRQYADRVIPVIRKNSPSSVIMVGTPDYCKDLRSVMRNPLQYDNIMYSLHFYASSHDKDLQIELITAVNERLPVFVTECGLSDATGNGAINFAMATNWFNILDKYDISYTIWSLSNKNETSAIFEPDYKPSLKITDNYLTECGLWVRPLIKGIAPDHIKVPDKNVGLQKLPHWIMGSLSHRDLSVAQSWPDIALKTLIILLIAGLLGLCVFFYFKKHYRTYNDLLSKEELKKGSRLIIYRIMLILSIFCTISYLIWRIKFSIPKDHGLLPITANILLLIVEIVGFFESVILYMNLIGIRNHKLPVISDDEYPDVDIFIATYNEPVELLRRTINGCIHMRYPDKSKVHVWVCDDNRRPAMRQLAADMGVGYFDRPDNKGAKAGNLNNALRQTSAPYVVTFDSDMIPKSDFLLKTIPYFVDAQKRSKELPENRKCLLGLLQTPQSFYDPDVYQYALYSEDAAPNEQDFFYRTIEVARTSTNSVIYGGSNTILSRQALEDIGGFYTETITEDFATGLLIESAGYVSLGLPEPLANGQTPHSFKEHIQQRKRWGMGVINSSRKLHLFTRKGLSLLQKLNYVSSVSYWFSPIKNLIYMLSPLFFAVFAIPVFECSWLDLIIYWLPMFIMQELCLRIISGGSISLKWSGIYETSVMPYLLIPIIKESLGISMSVFAVTDKSGRNKSGGKKLKTMLPLIILLALSLTGVVRVLLLTKSIPIINLIVLLFWIIRNAYFLAMSLFLIDGRYGDEETVNVKDAEFVTLKKETKDGKPAVFEGVTTYLNEHCVRVFLDEYEGLRIGDRVELNITNELYDVNLQTIVTGISTSRSGSKKVFSLEITDHGESWGEYEEILFDRIPSLPQSLVKDYGIIFHLLRNVAFRVLKTENSFRNI